MEWEIQINPEMLTNELNKMKLAIGKVPEMETGENLRKIQKENREIEKLEKILDLRLKAESEKILRGGIILGKKTIEIGSKERNIWKEETGFKKDIITIKSTILEQEIKEMIDYNKMEEIKKKIEEKANEGNGNSMEIQPTTDESWREKGWKRTLEESP